MKKILFTAAHSGFSLNRVPLGGGGAVAERLQREWSRTRPFDLEILSPSLLGPAAPVENDLVNYSELRYARFCMDFQAAITMSILKHPVPDSVVLSNDVSEGPDFERLATSGYPVFTIYHVDVVDYFTTFYLRGLVRPESTTAIYRGLHRFHLARFTPSILRLIWQKQADSVRFSRGLIVPSARMKEILVRCYPNADPGRIHVLPWGSWADDVPALEGQEAKLALLKEFQIPEVAPVLLTLSRISPEKGQDRILRALALWEKKPDYPKEGVCLFIAGEAAYMMGKKYLRKLQTLAAKLSRTRVHFVGYAAGAKKKALFELADLYVFASRHESYGLTLLEALRAGKPTLTTTTHGTLEVFHPEFGTMVQNGTESDIVYGLMEAMRGMLVHRTALKEMGQKAALWAKNQDFSGAASKLAALLASQ